MLHRKRRHRLIAVCIGMLLLPFLPAPSWTQQADYPFIYYPSPLAEKQLQVSVGLIQVQPAQEITEEVWVRAPAFDGHVLYGLPSNFSLDGRILSQVIQNHLSVGGRWTYPVGKFGISVGYDIAYWFGFLEVGGFDSKASGWLNYPSITIGYNTGDVRLLFKTEAILNLYYKSYVGENEVRSDQNKLVGWAFTTAFEQAFWKNTHITLGFRATYTKFHWMTWSLFSTFDRYLFYPEIIIGFII
jgi:hypothetical protein